MLIKGGYTGQAAEGAVVLETDIGGYQYRVKGIQLEFHSQVNAMIIVGRRRETAFLVKLAAIVIEEKLAAHLFVAGIIALIKKIAPADLRFFAPGIGKIDPESIGFTDTPLLAYQEILRISHSETAAKAASASSAAPSASSILVAGQTQQIFRCKILLVHIIE